MTLTVPPNELFGDGLPLVAMQLVSLEKSSLIQLTPETVIDFGVEVVIPSA
jgi:hypothetical protein